MTIELSTTVIDKTYCTTKPAKLLNWNCWRFVHNRRESNEWTSLIEYNVKSRQHLTRRLNRSRPKKRRTTSALHTNIYTNESIKWFEQFERLKPWWWFDLHSHDECSITVAFKPVSIFTFLQEGFANIYMRFNKNSLFTPIYTHALTGQIWKKRLFCDHIIRFVHSSQWFESTRQANFKTHLIEQLSMRTIKFVGVYVCVLLFSTTF